MRVESALFNDVMVQCLEKLGVEYTISAPFERLVVLKERIEKRTLSYCRFRECQSLFLSKPIQAMPTGFLGTGRRPPGSPDRDRYAPWS